MNITLYNTSSESNAMTKNLRVIQSMEGVLKESTSILNPVIQVTSLDVSTLSEVNYLYSPDFKRYYFITDVTSVNNNLWELTCRVDVLHTYQAQIKELTAVIQRQENVWNMYLDDGMYKSYQNPLIITKNFPSGFGDAKFILTLAGG